MSIYDGMIGKDVFLRKQGEYDYIGIHAIGEAGPYEYKLIHMDGTEEMKKSDFYAYETWGNAYDSKTHKMVGRGSFRVHAGMDQEVLDWIANGWSPFTPEGRDE